jgi:hypothetical protein
MSPLVDLSLPRAPFRSSGELVTDRAGAPVVSVAITGRLCPTSTYEQLEGVRDLEHATAARIAACLNYCDGVEVEDLTRLVDASLRPLDLIGTTAHRSPGVAYIIAKQLDAADARKATS